MQPSHLLGEGLTPCDVEGRGGPTLLYDAGMECFAAGRIRV